MLTATPKPGDKLIADVETTPDTTERLTVTVLEYLGDGWLLARVSNAPDGMKLELHEAEHNLERAL